MTTTTTEKFRVGEETRSSAEIENDIRRTRGRMDATLDELGNRLTARSLLNSALDWWEQRSPATQSTAGTKTKQAYRSVARQVKHHPGPSILIGAGVAWLLMEATSFDDEETVSYSGTMSGSGYRGDPSQSRSSMGGAGYSTYGDGGITHEEMGEEDGDHGPGIAEKTKDMAGQAREAVSGAAETLRKKASGIGDAVQVVADTVGQRTHEYYEQGRSAGRRLSHGLEVGYQSGTEQFQSAVQEYPLGVGIGFAAIGALLGLLLPRTRREDELLGERSDELVESVKEAGKEALEHGKQIASRVAEAAAGEAERQGLTAQSATGAISEFAGKAGEVLRKAKEEAGAAAEELKGEVQAR